MKPLSFRCPRKAFTLIELLVVLVVIGVLFTFVYPVKHRGHKASSIGCMSNLRQAGLGFLLYASDHANQFPWQISTNSTLTKGGMELRAASEHFLLLSNYAFPSRILVCPTDRARRAATNYANFNNSNLSYFAALSTITISDSNIITIGGSHPSQIAFVGDRHLSVDGQAVKPGLCTLNRKSAPDWTKELHNSDKKLTRGSLLFADGHVRFVPGKDLAKLFIGQSDTTTRLVIP